MHMHIWTVHQRWSLYIERYICSWTSQHVLPKESNWRTSALIKNTLERCHFTSLQLVPRTKTHLSLFCFKGLFGLFSFCIFIKSLLIFRYLLHVQVLRVLKELTYILVACQNLWHSWTWRRYSLRLAISLPQEYFMTKPQVLLRFTGVNWKDFVSVFRFTRSHTVTISFFNKGSWHLFSICKACI